MAKKRERKIKWESYHINNYTKTERDEILANLDEEDEEEKEIAEELRNMPTIMETPIGPVLKDDTLNPLYRIEHWMLHANFDITEKELIIANFHEGVESLSTVSRYEMLVGFGKLFDGTEVRKTLTEKLINIDDYPEELLKIQKDVMMIGVSK